MNTTHVPSKVGTIIVGWILILVILLTGKGLVPALDVKVAVQTDTHSDKLTQIKDQIMKTSLWQLIGPTTQAVAKAYSDVSSNSVQQLVKQLVKEVINDSGQDRALSRPSPDRLPGYIKP